MYRRVPVASCETLLMPIERHVLPEQKFARRSANVGSVRSMTCWRSLLHHTKEDYRTNRTSPTIFAERCAPLDPMLLRKRHLLQKRVVRTLHRGRPPTARLFAPKDPQQEPLLRGSECRRMDDPKSTLML